MLNERTGSKLEGIAVVVLLDDSDVADENDRCAEDDDTTSLYVVVPAAVISSSRAAYVEEYVRVLLVGLAESNVTSSSGILLGFAVKGS